MTQVHVATMPLTPAAAAAPAEPAGAGEGFQALLAALEESAAGGPARAPIAPAAVELDGDEPPASEPAAEQAALFAVVAPFSTPVVAQVARGGSEGEAGSGARDAGGLGAGAPSVQGVARPLDPAATIAGGEILPGAGDEDGLAAPGREAVPALATESGPAPAPEAAGVAHPAAAAPAEQALAPREPSLRLARPVGDPGWSTELAAPVVQLALRGEHAAELQVTPPELGPIGVRIEVADGAATVVFAAAHAETRAALEQALPRLAEALAGAGIALADARVGRGWRQAERDAPYGAAAADGERGATLAAPVRAIPAGRIDVFV